ncbi:MAG: nucleotidyltransferase domain-containing protein [Candidatus Saganbacteria bacterium]|uniref:Nucleotidyltransferase domain-containing protein n=1 Tax=Candidatus Saganbacteria bacterium TaxID=2575572 RepID=A0A833L105_UNCSA|nr:MAG: nucleotidyltransferase domain-containing protein [Candidatus Saganbacteria bacterium]
MSKTGLKIIEEELRNISQRIAKRINPKRLILFGSRAAGQAKPDSDIDLCVIEDNMVDKSEEFIKIRKVLEDSIIPLDILIFNKNEFDKRKDIWGTVQYEIDKNGKILYERRD